jgi:hypothetical protein
MRNLIPTTDRAGSGRVLVLKGQFTVQQPILEFELTDSCRPLSRKRSLSPNRSLIHDLQTGKPYVGSAYGDIGIWARLCQYVDSLRRGENSVRCRAERCECDSKYVTV